MEKTIDKVMAAILFFGACYLITGFMYHLLKNITVEGIFVMIIISGIGFVMLKLFLDDK